MAEPSPGARLLRVLREAGPLGALRTVRDALQLRAELARGRRFDRVRGVETCGSVEIADLQVESANARFSAQYEPAPVGAIRRALDTIARHAGSLEGYTLVDYGSGKGRVLLIAAEYSFRRVQGIEFARELHAIAARNIDQLGPPRRRCREVVSLHADASEVDLPPGPLVLFMYSPFGEPLMSRVLDRIEASWRASPRKIYLAYANPFHRESMDARAFLRPLEMPRPWYRRWLPDRIPVILYESMDGSAQSTGKRSRTGPRACLSGSSQGSKWRHCSRPDWYTGWRTCSELGVRMARSVS